MRIIVAAAALHFAICGSVARAQGVNDPPTSASGPTNSGASASTPSRPTSTPNLGPPRSSIPLGIRPPLREYRNYRQDGRPRDR